jgi:hypothetical protein
MNQFDDSEHLLEDRFPVFAAMSNAIFSAMLPWLPKELDTARLALLGEVVMCLTFPYRDVSKYGG